MTVEGGLLMPGVGDKDGVAVGTAIGGEPDEPLPSTLNTTTDFAGIW